MRELTGGIYFGPRKEADEKSPDEAFDTEVYSKAEIERITRLAGAMAMKHSPPLKITSLDKANVLATSRLWRKTVTEVLTREFPEVRFDHQLIDSACMTAVVEPTKLNGVSFLFGRFIPDSNSKSQQLTGRTHLQHFRRHLFRRSQRARWLSRPPPQRKLGRHPRWKRFEMQWTLRANPRQRSRHIRKRHRESDRHDPFGGNDAAVFFQPAG